MLINTLDHEPQAPFGGMKQSGLGREMGHAGLSGAESRIRGLSTAPASFRALHWPTDPFWQC
nr:hypothetical protein [Sodalis glossinidius]